MADKMTYTTAEGLQSLKVELHELTTKTRRELANRIEAAKDLGDLKENAEYHEAKEALGMTEGRIRQITEMLKNVSVIESGGSSVVRVGSTVEVEVNGKVKTYTIVGSNEADPVVGRISNESPLGSAFLGHAMGEDVEVETRAGTTMYRIQSIS